MEAVRIRREGRELGFERLGRHRAAIADFVQRAKEPGDVDDAGLAGEGADAVELFVHGEACYTATDPALIEQPNITNAKGKSVANPLQQFDGCFDVYDNKTSITK